MADEELVAETVEELFADGEKVANALADGEFEDAAATVPETITSVLIFADAAGSTTTPDTLIKVFGVSHQEQPISDRQSRHERACSHAGDQDRPGTTRKVAKAPSPISAMCGSTTKL